MGMRSYNSVDFLQVLSAFSHKDKTENVADVSSVVLVTQRRVKILVLPIAITKPTNRVYDLGVTDKTF